MKTKILSGLLLLAISLQSMSCATIIAGTGSRVHVKGEQPDAKVFYNGSYQGTAPCTVRVPKKDLKREAVIEVRKEGYEPQQVKLGKKVMVGWVLWEVVTVLSIIPPIVDLATGSISKATPEHVKYNLEPKEKVAGTKTE